MRVGRQRPLPAPVAVAPAVWARFPALRLVVVEVAGLDNTGTHAVLAGALADRQAMLRAGWQHATAAGHPHLARWREVMRAIGVKPGKQPASIEALVKRALGERPLLSINPLVDLVHLVSLRHLIPAGGWDLEALRAPLTLGFTHGGERFQALGAEQATSVQADELAYLAGAEVVTRHFVWRQSEHGKITAGTERAVLVAEIPHGRAPNLAGRVRDDFTTLLTEHLGVAARTWVLHG